MPDNSTTIAVPADRLLYMVKRLMEFPYPQICRHLVACDLLSLLVEYGYPVSNELAGAVVRAEDDVALEILNEIPPHMARHADL